MSAQLIGAIMNGLHISCPADITPSFLSSLGPDKITAVDTLSQAVATLQLYFTNPARADPTQWDQCLQCLQVNGIEISHNHWKAQLMTGNQQVNTMQLSILNTCVHQFKHETMNWIDDQC
jgi:hypothetical protein